MPVEITPIFLVLAMVIGLLVGLLVSSLFSSRESKSAEADQPPQELVKDGFAEVVRLWYSPSGKKIVTQLDGGYYKDFLTLSPDQKTRVNKLLVLWSTWAGKGIEVKTDPNFSPVMGEQSSDASDRPPIKPLLDWSVQEALKSKETANSPILPVEDRPKTIAGQISLIIEKRLVDSPIKEKGIKLIENDHHGVDVWIGLEKFDGIDAIPYPDVQQLIREAVAQWEREMEAGKN
ncbi:MAG: hypothetical protein C0410_04575 [Anaerolinea sp.]|nr:hypothetical protein [Anaerolinea sp.]